MLPKTCPSGCLKRQMLRPCRHLCRIHHPSASDAWIFKKIRKWLSRRTRRCSVLSTYCAAHGCPIALPLRGDAARAHARSAAPVSSRHNAFDRSSTLRRAQVWCVAALPNGRVVSGSEDRTLKVWDPSSAQCLRTMSGHTYDALRRVPSNRASIARRRREGRRSGASPRCRMATSCPDRGTTRSRCGTSRPASAWRRCKGTQTTCGARRPLYLCADLASS